MATAEHPTQQRAALLRANESRLGAAAVKREVRAGSMSIAEAFADSRAGVLRVGDLLAVQTRWSIDRAARMLAPLGITATTRVRDLTAAQCEAIAGAKIPHLHVSRRRGATGSRRGATGSRLIREKVARYVSASGEQRTVALVVNLDARVLVDRGPGGEREIERFDATAGLLEIAAVAQGYLDEIKGRPA